MYRRSTGRLIHVSDDLLDIRVKIKISWKNKNYVGTIFGGSMASATDPIYMIQLMNILGNEYVVWEKEANIRFKKPAKVSVYAHFSFTPNEIEQIKRDVKASDEIDVVKYLSITNKTETIVFAELKKIIYVADKQFYKTQKKRK
ncbi:MAG: DUF4442 domain-containing protein [Ekhidna sp.]